MLDRILGASFLFGAAFVALILFQQTYAAPSCRADVVTSQVAQQIGPHISSDGLRFRNIRSTTGGFLARSRDCEMEVAPIVGFQTAAEAHWTKVVYSEARERTGKAIRVTARVVGADRPAFAGVPGDHAAAPPTAARAD